MEGRLKGAEAIFYPCWKAKAKALHHRGKPPRALHLLPSTQKNPSPTLNNAAQFQSDCLQKQRFVTERRSAGHVDFVLEHAVIKIVLRTEKDEKMKGRP